MCSAGWIQTGDGSASSYDMLGSQCWASKLGCDVFQSSALGDLNFLITRVYFSAKVFILCHFPLSISAALEAMRSGNTWDPKVDLSTAQGLSSLTLTIVNVHLATTVEAAIRL